VARSTADASEGLSGRKSVVIARLAASAVELTNESGSAFDGLILLIGTGIAVGVTAAGELALISRVGSSALAVALAAGVALGADVSAGKGVVLRESTLGGNTDNLVDLLTEAELVEEDTTVRLLTALLVAETGDGQRDILLRNVEGIGLELEVTGLLLMDSGHGVDAEELLHGDWLHISITVLARLSGVEVKA